MKRTDRYPDTNTFHYYNANPKNRLTGDCVARAVSTATGIPYNDVVMGLAKVQCETGYDPTEGRGLERYMESLGWVKQKQPRKKNNTKYTGSEWCSWLTKHCVDVSARILANIGGHHMVSIEFIDRHFKVFDTWDSTEGCIGNYWIKK